MAIASEGRWEADGGVSSRKPRIAADSESPLPSAGAAGEAAPSAIAAVPSAASAAGSTDREGAGGSGSGSPSRTTEEPVLSRPGSL